MTLNWIRVGLSDEQIDYFLRKFLDNLMLEEKLANTNKLVEEKEMWQGSSELNDKEIKSISAPATGDHDDVYIDTSEKPAKLILRRGNNDYSVENPAWLDKIKSKRLKPYTKKQAIANIRKTKKLLGLNKVRKRDKNGRFISTKRKRMT